MRYTESREQSAELVRRVLALMSQHDAAFNPVSYAVWYEFAAGMNLRLTHAIELALQTEPRLGDASLVRLYQAHVAEASPQAMQRISSELQRMMLGLAQDALRTGDQAGSFGAQLLDLTLALKADDPSAIASLVSQALVGTAEMRSAAQALEQQVQLNRQEIRRLQGDLLRARDEAVIDPLTGVLNRKGFDQQLASMLAHATEPAHSNCLILLDNKNPRPKGRGIQNSPCCASECSC